MIAVAAKKKRVHVTLTDVFAGPCVVEAEHSDGSLVIAPDTSRKAVRTSGRGEELTRQRWHDFLTEQGVHMQPPDES